MPTVSYSERFQKDFLELDATLQNSIADAIKTFMIDPRYPSLHFKKMKGHENRYEMRVNDSFRITLSKNKDGVFILRRVGPHNVLKKP